MRAGERERGRKSSFLAALLLLVLGLAACDGSGPEAPLLPGDARFREAEEHPGTWQWIGVEGTRCREGTPTGLGVRLQPEAEGLVVFMAGGGVCLNGAVCDPEPKPFTEATFDSLFASGGQGLFDDGRSENPLRTWDIAYLPYCTGDLFAGSAPEAVVDSVPGRQQFVGRRNVQRYLEVLAPYFAERERVLLIGISAGGFGAAFNYAAVADAFAPTPVTLLIDSAPLLRDDRALSPALQQAWRDVWNLEAALPPRAACPACYGPGGDGLSNLYGYVAEAYPEARFGLLSSEADGAVRAFYSLGRPGCTKETPQACVTPQAYWQALADQRAALPPAWATYVQPGREHVYAVEDAAYYGTTVGGMPLTDWIEALLRGDVLRVTAP